MNTQQTFLEVSQSESVNSIEGQASSQSWAWSKINVILLLGFYHKSVKLVTKYGDFIHFIALHVLIGSCENKNNNEELVTMPSKIGII